MRQGQRYRLLEPLGRGQLSTTYRADRHEGDAHTGRVAVKVFSPEVEGIDEVARRLREESAVQRLIDHDGVVRIHGVVRVDDRWAVVMDLVDGVTLDELMSRGPLPPSVAVGVVQQVAGALHAAWSSTDSDGLPLKLHHGDLRPDRIMITAAGDIRLLDFEIARVEVNASDRGQINSLFMTPQYQPPERRRPAEPARQRDLAAEGAAGDVYAMGAILFEALTGGAIFADPSDASKHTAHVVEGIKRAAEEVHGNADVLVHLLGTMLAFHPNARPTAREVSRQAKTLARELGGSTVQQWAAVTVPEAQASRTVLPADELTGMRFEVGPDGDSFGGFELTDPGSEPIDDEITESEGPSVVPMAPPQAAPTDALSPAALRAPAPGPVPGPDVEVVDEDVTAVTELDEPKAGTLGGAGGALQDRRHHPSVVKASVVPEPEQPAPPPPATGAGTLKVVAVPAAPRAPTPTPTRPKTPPGGNRAHPRPEPTPPTPPAEPDLSPEDWEDDEVTVLAQPGMAARVRPNLAQLSRQAPARPAAPEPVAPRAPAHPPPAPAPVAPSPPRPAAPGPGVSPLAVPIDKDTDAPALAPPPKRRRSPLILLAGAAAFLVVVAVALLVVVPRLLGGKAEVAPTTTLTPAPVTPAPAPPAPAPPDEPPAAEPPAAEPPAAEVPAAEAPPAEAAVAEAPAAEAPPAKAEAAKARPTRTQPAKVGPAPAANREAAPPSKAEPRAAASAEPESDEPPPPARIRPNLATVEVSGDAVSVKLVTGSRKLAPGRVPAGTYYIEAVFTEGEDPVTAGQVTLEAGATAKVTCSARFTLCTTE